jgi:hypothetical protein
MPGWSRNRRLDLAIQMAGHSGKPVTQKLGIQPGFCIFIAGVPRPTFLKVRPSDWSSSSGAGLA